MEDPEQKWILAVPLPGRKAARLAGLGQCDCDTILFSATLFLQNRDLQDGFMMDSWWIHVLTKSLCTDIRSFTIENTCASTHTHIIYFPGTSNTTCQLRWLDQQNPTEGSLISSQATWTKESGESLEQGMTTAQYRCVALQNCGAKKCRTDPPEIHRVTKKSAGDLAATSGSWDWASWLHNGWSKAE